MRALVLLAPGLLLAACAQQPSVPPQVSWSYGAGNGDGVQYQGPAPKFSWADGLGKDVPVSSGQKPNVSYGYGADGTTGDMVQMSKPDQPMVAQPAQLPTGTHS